MKFLLLILLAFCSIILYAQTPDTLKAVYSVHASSTGSFSKTNDLKSYVFNNVVKLGVTRGRLSFQNTDGWIYGAQSGIKINNDYSSVIEGDYLKNTNKLYAWALGTFDKSFSLKINFRYQVGAGPGYTVVKNNKISLIVSDGIMYEQGDLVDPELGGISYSTWRNSFRVKYHWLIKDFISWDGTGFVQPSLSHKHDDILRYSTTLSVKVRKWLSITSGLTYNKLTRTQRENLVVTYGVAINYN
jgi:hypothetical protein